MYKDTITLFNRKEGDEGDTWYPTVLRNVHLNMDRATILVKYGPNAADSAVLNVRYIPDGENKMVARKRWVPPKVWQACDKPSQSITFSTGTKFDFFWVGDWGNEDPIHDADYSTDMDFYTYMNRTHDYVFAVSSVGGPYSVIPHFEILGK